MPNLPFAKKWWCVDFLRTKKFVTYSVFMHGLFMVLFLGQNPINKLRLPRCSAIEIQLLSSIVDTESLTKSIPADPLLSEVLPKEEKACKTPEAPSQAFRTVQKSTALSAKNAHAQAISDAFDDDTGETPPDMTRPPVLLKNNLPPIAYPKEAKHLRIEGVVKLELTIDEEGQVKDAKVIEGLGFGLSTQALKLVKNLRFLPALNPRGEREMASIMHEVVFRLNRRDG